jgi:Na+/H+ antiporter NhaA
VLDPPAMSDEPTPEQDDATARWLYAGWAVVLLLMPLGAFAGAGVLLAGEDLDPTLRSVLLGTAIAAPPLAIGLLGVAWVKTR